MHAGVVCKRRQRGWLHGVEGILMMGTPPLPVRTDFAEILMSVFLRDFDAL